MTGDHRDEVRPRLTPSYPAGGDCDKKVVGEDGTEAAADRDRHAEWDAGMFGMRGVRARRAVPAGMTGHARIYTGERPIGEIALDRVLRFVRTEFWW